MNKLFPTKIITVSFRAITHTEYVSEFALVAYEHRSVKQLIFMTTHHKYKS